MSHSAVDVWESPEAHRRVFESWECRYCGHVGTYYMGPASGPHYGKVFCEECGRGLGFLPKPRTAQEQRTRRPARPLTRLSDDRCHACGRTRLQAKLDGAELEAHHLIDRATLIDHGVPDPDAPEWLRWACSFPCHGILTALRKSFNGYLSLLDAAGAVEAAPTGVEWPER